MKRRPRIDWPAVAERLAQEVPRERLDPAVRAWADEASLRSAWHVALSGGADSVALVLLVWAHWPERRSRLCALHFDHRLRGAESRADARFCSALCRGLRITFKEEVWRRPRGEAHRASVSEAEAREARLAFFDRHARALWLGQNQDDVAETLLMRLARGSGAGGLSAPRPVQPVGEGRLRLRPLLRLRKNEIVTTLRAAGGSWREDRTNTESHYFRNRIRRDVLPAWDEAARRDAVAGAARTRELLEEDDRALESWVDQLAPIGASGDLLLRRLAGQPRAVLRRALHRWLLQIRPRVDLSRQAFDALLQAVENGKPTRHSLGVELFAALKGGRLTVEVGKRRARFQRRVN
jgi:tRNA(Ile)-lysidine synthase